METIATTELSEPLQQLLTHIQRSNKPLTVTHQGEPIVIIYPAKKAPPRPAFGIMQQSGEILGDLVESIVPQSDWEVLQ